MKRLYPSLSGAERTVKARELFFDSICEYISKNPKVRNTEIIDINTKAIASQKTAGKGFAFLLLLSCFCNKYIASGIAIANGG